MGLLNMYDAIEFGKPYPIRAAWFAFINFVNQCANNRRIIHNIIPKLDFIVATELFMTSTAQYADVVLPVCTFLEFTDLVDGPHPFIQLQQRVIPPLYEAKSDVQILGELASRLGFGEAFMSEEKFIELLLSSGHPSVAGISVDKLREGPVRIKPINQPAENEQLVEYLLAQIHEHR